MLNKATLIGNLGKDPELRKTPSGMDVCNFSVATTEKFTRKDGTKVDETEWHNITTWGKLATICGQYLRKGSKVYIEGKIKTRSYESAGVTKYTTDIIASEMKMLDSKGGNSDNYTAPQAPQAPQGLPADDELPF